MSRRSRGQSQSCFFFRFRDISTVRGNNRANRMIAVSFVWKRHQLGELLQHAVRLEVQTRQLAPNDQPPESEPGVRLHVPPTSFGSHGLSITIESRQDFVQGFMALPTQFMDKRDLYVITVLAQESLDQQLCNLNESRIAGLDQVYGLDP